VRPPLRCSGRQTTPRAGGAGVGSRVTCAPSVECVHEPWWLLGMYVRDGGWSSERSTEGTGLTGKPNQDWARANQGLETDPRGSPRGVFYCNIRTFCVACVCRLLCFACVAVCLCCAVPFCGTQLAPLALCPSSLRSPYVADATHESNESLALRSIPRTVLRQQVSAPLASHPTAHRVGQGSRAELLFRGQAEETTHNDAQQIV